MKYILTGLSVIVYLLIIGISCLLISEQIFTDIILVSREYALFAVSVLLLLLNNNLEKHI